MKLYRVNKLAKAGGATIGKKHILAQSDKDAMQQASESPDCPICDVLRDGEQVGSISRPTAPPMQEIRKGSVRPALKLH